MKKQFRMERQVPYLSEQDFKKLFPQQYFTKYAEHLNILKFEETVFKDPRPKAEKQFTDRTKRTASQGNLRQTGKVKLNRYDPVSDTIAKNKVETVRMEKFVRTLDHKLKQGPSKTVATIRTPLKGYNQLTPEVLDKMRFIQNEQYSREMQLLREKRRAEDEFVHFKIRNRSISPSKFSVMSRSILADSVQSKSIGEKDYAINLSNNMQFHPTPDSGESMQRAHQGSQSLTYHQRLTQLMAQARSQVSNLNPQCPNVDVKYIMAMNRSIRKINTLKDEMRSERRRRTVAEWKMQGVMKNHLRAEGGERKRKNLIAMTEQIRKDGERIEILSRYQNLVRERQFKQFLIEKENGAAVPIVKQGNL